MKSKNILIAIAWPYVNGDIHPGHLGGYLLPADITARYHRLLGNDVLMVSGSDCHGTPITIEADKRETSPQNIVSEYHKKTLSLFSLYQLSFNIYTKTTTENHEKLVQELFLKMLKNGYIVPGMMKQYYNQEKKKFLPDRYIVGQCSYCKAENQRSDQCEVCGRWLAEGELINPRNKETGKPVELKDTEHYFFDLEKITPLIEEYVKTKEKIWKDWVFAETIGWIKQGLTRRSITRDLDWGIELPVKEIEKLEDNMKLKDYEGKCIYVWFEAVIGYLSASIEWSHTKSPEEDILFKEYKKQSRDWRDWWENKKSEHYYFMGQDNLIFHTILWPAQLIASGENYQLPYNVVVNKFMSLNNQKFSKSRGNTIDSKELALKYGVDEVRFYISRILPENKEANFTISGLEDAINNELIANLGNFIYRTLYFATKNFEGKIIDEKYSITPEVEKKIQNTYTNTSNFLNNMKIGNALLEILNLSRFGNQYFNDSKVWELNKSNELETRKIVLDLLNIVLNLSILTEPFLPNSSKELREFIKKTSLDPIIGENLWKINIENAFEIVETTKLSPLFKKVGK